MSGIKVFDPTKDGWCFCNFQDAGPFPWDLYREAYLGIHPTQDCVAAPLDCAFYEIFKSCAAQGNCGGMTLLDLAIFKYGGYMGFCAPPCFYTGVDGPDRVELHRAINTIQARQFSAPGVQHFIDIVGAGLLNNADAAFNKVKELLGSGDYTILAIANSMLGDSAHTIIPYALDESPVGFPPGTKLMYVWDPDLPYNQYPDYYINQSNRVVINSAFDWEYNQGAGVTEPNNDQVDFRGTNNGWCFAVPLSLVIHKARQPMTLDILFQGLVTIFVSGPGATVSQIEDEQGRRFYTADEEHQLRGEIESNPRFGMPSAVRWPWYGQNQDGNAPGELYFLRRPAGSGQLKVTVHGTDYKLMYAQAGNLVQVEAGGGKRARDLLTLDGLAGAAQALELRTSAARRDYHIQQLRTFTKGGSWRDIQVNNVRLNNSGVHVQTVGDLHIVKVTGLNRRVNFDVEMRQYRNQSLASRKLSGRTTVAGRSVQFAPRDWEDLEHTELE